MSAADRKGLTPDQLALQAFLSTPAGRELHELIHQEREGHLRAQAEEAEREAREAVDRQIEATLAAEREAFDQAGLVEFNGTDAMGHTSVRYSQQPVVLLNSFAHPSALVASALARAERAQAFARVFEQSELVSHGHDLQTGTYTLARMIEEVVDLLQVALDHKGISGAPVSAMQAT